MENLAGRMVFREARDIAEHLEVFSVFDARALFQDAARQQLYEWAGLHTDRR